MMAPCDACGVPYWHRGGKVCPSCNGKPEAVEAAHAALKGGGLARSALVQAHKHKWRRQAFYGSLMEVCVLPGCAAYRGPVGSSGRVIAEQGPAFPSEDSGVER